MVDELEWIPDDLTVKGGARARYGNTDKAGKCECNRDYDELDILSMRMLVSGTERVGPLKRMFAYARSVLAYL
jgi:hypothetical protein